jgi:hypothetical protein
MPNSPPNRRFSYGVRLLACAIRWKRRLEELELLNDVGSLFAPETFKAVPTIVQYDLAEAGKCIAFERPTAAAFHILRGTEGVLRHYYTRMVRHGAISERTWGPLVSDLRKRKLTKKYETLNNHLDNIRVSFRNPTQHPEAIGQRMPPSRGRFMQPCLRSC